MFANRHAHLRGHELARVLVGDCFHGIFGGGPQDLQAVRIRNDSSKTSAYSRRNRKPESPLCLEVSRQLAKLGDRSGEGRPMVGAG